MTRHLSTIKLLTAFLVTGLLSMSASAAMDAAHQEMYDQSKSFKERLAAVKKHTGFPKDPNKKYRVCIFDPIGRNGPIYNIANDKLIELLQLGIKTELTPYVSESVLVEELKSGTCAVALMSGIRARFFNKFTGSLDAPGAMLNAEQVRTMYKLVTDPRLADKMVEGDYIIGGVLPLGPVHAFVNDREIDSIEKAAGKRVLVLDFDPMQADLASSLGATPVVSDIANAGNKFNNRNVDVLISPLAAYNFFELYKGLEPKGAIIDLPIIYASMQLVVRKDNMPNEAVQILREIMYETYDKAWTIVESESKKIPSKWWVHLPESDKLRYDKLMQEIRLKLIKDDYFNPYMLTLLRKARCAKAPSRPECSNPVE